MNTIVRAIRAHLMTSANQSAINYSGGTGLVGLPLAACFESLLLVDTSPRKKPF